MFSFLTERLSSAFNNLLGSKVTPESIASTLATVRASLIDADVPLEVVDQLIKEVEQAIVGQKITQSLRPGELFIKTLHDRLVNFLSAGIVGVDALSVPIPSVILVMGLQGSGKTTTIAKLAYQLQEQAHQKNKKRRILTASVDFYRPAAIDQLQVLAERVGVDFYRATATAPVAAAQEIMQHYKAGSYDYLLLDTAGRMHVDEALLIELQSIVKIAQPRLKILVLDAMTGQQSLTVAQAFLAHVKFDGAILTKMDSDTRAGAALAFAYMLKKPIIAVGNGERPEDFEYFRPARVAKRLIGLGDLETLLEKAQERIKDQDQEEMAKRLLEGQLTFDDFLTQMQMMSRLGSLGSVMQMMPGLGVGPVSKEQVAQGEKDLKRFKAIIQSMTPKERLSPDLIKEPSRQERIAAGAGVPVAAIGDLVVRFDQSRQFAKLLKKNSLFQSFLRR